jgi:hypothetical protein
MAPGGCTPEPFFFTLREASGRRRNKDNIGRLGTNLIPSLWRLGESDGSGAAVQPGAIFSAVDFSAQVNCFSGWHWKSASAGIEYFLLPRTKPPSGE